jgi:hypothetical protein
MTREQKSQKASAWQAARAVFWSFFGVRKSADYNRDAVRLTPGQVIAAGLVGAVLFIATLVGIVYVVMH